MSSNNVNCESVNLLSNFITINEALQAIELFNCNLNEEGIITILTALQQNLSLTKLNLGANVITNEAAKHLATLITNNHSMTHLYLKECALQYVELKCLADVLADSQSFLECDFSYNIFSDQNCQDIAHVIKHNINATHFNLSNCELKEEGMLSLATVLHDTECLMFLNLDRNQINDLAANNIAVALCKNTKLEFLSISKCVISNEGLQSIMKSMKEIQNLKYLDISFIEVRDQAALDVAAVIDVNNNLEHLNFSHCGLQNDELITVLKAINKLEKLKYLNLSSNSITVKAANEIATFISKNNPLEHLHISNCKFNEDGLLTIAKRIKLLNTFDISLNTITSTTLSEFSEMIVISQFKHFNISNCCIKEKLTLFCQALSKNGHLKCINFGGIAMNDTEAKHLGHAITINNCQEQLILSNCKLHATGLLCILHALKKITGIKYLDLMSNEFDDESMMMLVEIVSNNALEYFNISDCLHNTDISILVKEIAIKGTLTHINLSCNSIGNTYANSISDFISTNHNLQHINLSSNSFADGGTKIILNGMGKLYSLKSVEFENYDMTNDQLKHVIMNNSSLKIIKLRKLLLKNIHTKTLFANFIGQILLEELCIESSKLDDSEVKLILSIISTNPHVQSISLVYCTFSTSELKIDVFNSLCSLRRLHHLALYGSDIVNEIEDQLVAVINSNTQLNHLEVVGPELSEKIFISIFINIKKMLHLNLSNNSLTAEIVTKALPDLSNLLPSEICKPEDKFKMEDTTLLNYIDISCNSLTNTGINAFVQTIMASPCLEYLNVSNCLLESKGINTIVKAINGLTSLKYLDLSLNNLMDENEFNIEVTIKNNKELEYLFLPNCTLKQGKTREYFYCTANYYLIENSGH